MLQLHIVSAVNRALDEVQRLDERVVLLGRGIALNALNQHGHDSIGGPLVGFPGR